MHFYTVQKDQSLKETAKLTGRSARTLAAVNGISPHAHLRAGETILIPVHPRCRIDGCPELMLCGKAEAEKQGSALIQKANNLSLLLCVSHGLPARRVHGHIVTPRILSPVANIMHSPSAVADTLLKCGYEGIALSPACYTPGYLMLLRRELREQNLLLCLYIDANISATSPHIAMIAERADMLFAVLPSDISLETYIADLSLTLPIALRRKTLLSFPVAMENGAPSGRRHHISCSISPHTYHLGITRLIHDHYAGIILPVGSTPPMLYHMVTELCEIIPASRKNDVRSRS